MLMTYFIRLLVLFTAMPVHECAHGLAADRLGDDTPRSQGRLTLNPFAHLDLMGSVLLLLVGFGWAKPVEVDMRNFKHPRRDMALSSLAGPASNVLIALVVMAAYKVILFGVMPSMRTDASMEAVARIFVSVILINVSLAVFNFLPVPPLDGSKIIGAVLPEKLYWGMLRYQRQISMVLMLLLVFDVLDGPIMFLSGKLFYFLDIITSPIDMLFR